MSANEKAHSGGATSEQANGKKIDTLSPIQSITHDWIVASLLSSGADNAKSAQELCSALGLTSERALRKEIERERIDGAVILSNQQTGGYYLPDNLIEVKNFIQVMTARAKTTFLSIRSARCYLKDHKDKSEAEMRQ